MSGTARLWRLLTEAPATVTGPERCRQIQLLSGLLVVLIPLGLLAIVAELLVLPDFWPTFVAVGSSLVGLLCAYGLVRAGKFTASALLSITVAATAGFAIILLNVHDPFMYAFLLLPILLAALLFSETGAWITATGVLAGVSVLLPAWQVPPPGDDSLVVPIYIIIVTALLHIGIRHRNALARDRQAEHMASEEFAAGLISHAPVIVLVLDGDGRIVRVNRYFERLSGYRADEVVGRDWFDTLLPERDRARLRALFSAARSGTPTRGNVNPIVTRAGEKRDIEWSDSVLRDAAGNVTGVLAIGQDVTDRRRTELALRDSEALLAKAQEVAHIGSWSWDIASNDVLWSRETYRLFGTNAETSEQPWEILARVVHPDDRAQLQQSIERAARAGEAIPLEFRLIWADGTEHLIWAEGALQCSPDGKPVRMIGTMQDITERKRVENNLLEIARGVSASTGEHFFHSLVAHLARMLDADFAFIGELVVGDRIRTVAVLADGQTAANFEYVLSGTPCQNVVGKETCAYPSGVIKQFPDDHMLVEMGIEAYVGTPLFGAAGQTLGLLTLLFRRPIHGDSTVASTLEIFAARAAAELERVHAEQALRASEARYRNIVETAQEGIWQIEADNRTTFVNQKMADMLGYTVKEMLSQTLFDFMDDEGKAIAAHNVERRRQGIAEQHDFKFRRKDGSEVWAELNTTPLLDSAGGYAGALAMITDITERRRAEQALRDSEVMLARAQEMTHLGSWRWQVATGNVTWSDEMYRIYGLSPDTGAVSFERAMAAIHPEDRAFVAQQVQDMLAGKEIEHYEYRIVRPDGVQRNMWARSEVQRAADGSPQFVIGTVQDITERVSADARMRKLSSAIEQTADTVVITDRHGTIEYVNQGFETTTGYGRDEALGGKTSLLKSGKQGAAFYKKLWGTILAGEVFNEVFVNRRKDGSLYYEEKTISPLKDHAGRVTHFVSTGKDVTDRMQIQERLQHMAQHDALTELPNRVLFLDRLKQALARARWHERLVAVLFVDVDRFKTINDSLGHEVGDKLLQALSVRFAASVREGDTVARFGGDEFVMLLDDVASEKDIGALAQKVIEMLAPPFEIDGQSLYITASIGVSLYPNDGEDATTLLKHADTAMYRAKDAGKNTYQFYSSDMSARAFERLTLESSLRHAIERNEFRLHYQPQIDTVSGAVLGVEALLRWQHPDFGLVAPAEFIPLLEETGLIVPVGDWVLHTACEQLRAWHAAGWPQLRMAVNLSPRQFHAAGLAEALERGLSTLGCDPALLELEITESVLLRHTATTLETLEALHALGARLAIDDFGTGYSSLSYLRRYSIDTLKVDRSFVRDVPGDADDSALASAIIVLAQSLKLDVIAEGVETEAQRDFLRERGCHVMQGYLFSRPLPAEEIPRLLEIRNPKG